MHIQPITALDVLLTLAKNCKKDIIFDNLRTMTQEGDMKTRLMTPFFHLLLES